MKDFLGSFALLFCFIAIVVGPFLLPRLPEDEKGRPAKPDSGPAPRRKGR